MTSRKYTLKQRAKRKEATRERIVRATAGLHEELGPRNTTISAIAERAGVQRLTVYRHFPDEEQLFEACTSHWLARHPPPDPAIWSEMEDPAERTRVALEALYSYFGQTERMWSGAFRDRPEIPAMEKPMLRVDAYLDGIRMDLLRSWEASKGHSASGAPKAILGLAVRFSTWRSLDQEGLTSSKMAELVTRWVEASGL